MTSLNRFLQKIFFLFIVSFGVQHVIFLQAETLVPFDAQLSIAAAYQNFEAGNFQDSAKASYALIRSEKNGHVAPADAFFILGNIHLKEELYTLASSYYKEAEKKIASFIIKENIIKLYFYSSLAYFQLNQALKQIEYLEKVSSLAKDRQGRLYEKYSGPAYFMLGLAYGELSENAKSLQNLVLAAEQKFNAKTAYLLIAAYYAKNGLARLTGLDDEDELFHIAEFKNSEKTLYRLNKSDLRSSFLFYENLYLNTLSSRPRERRSLEQKNIYLQKQQVVQEYRKLINEEFRLKRAEDKTFLEAQNTDN